jgi:hypothetical protein
MKYAKFWEFRPEDMDEAIEVWGAYLEESKKTPEKYPTYLYPPHGFGDISKGVSIMEADNEEQLINYMVALAPSIKIKFVPLVDSSKIVEAYLKKRSVK